MRTMKRMPYHDRCGDDSGGLHFVGAGRGIYGTIRKGRLRLFRRLMWP